MDSKIKAKLIQFLESGDIGLALSFLREIQTHDGNYTTQQRKAVWVYMGKRADALNDAGLDVRKVLKPTFNIPWTKDSVHDLLWIPIQKAMFKTDTMRALKKKQVSDIHAVIERELAEKFGTEYIPFPSDEERQLQELSGVRLAQADNLNDTNYPEHTEPTI